MIVDRLAEYVEGYRDDAGTNDVHVVVVDLEHHCSGYTSGKSQTTHHSSVLNRTDVLLLEVQVNRVHVVTIRVVCAEHIMMLRYGVFSTCGCTHGLPTNRQCTTTTNGRSTRKLSVSC